MALAAREGRDDKIISYMFDNRKFILSLIADHLVLFFISILLAFIIGLGFGILTAKVRKSSFIEPIVNILQAAPDLVLLALAILIFGVNVQAAIAALFVKGLLPIMRNTFSGIRNVDKTVIEAARGMGMSNLRILFQIELPLALPVILSGVRVASVMAVSTITLAAYIGVQSLGVLITRGIATSNTDALFTGSLLTALLAVLLNYAILWLERTLLTSRRC